MTFVKICGITNEADALLCVGMGADALGFMFAPSTRQVSVKQVERIIERIPKGIVTVGVFRNESPKRVVEIVNGIGLGAAQLHGLESVDDSTYVADRVGLLIKAFPAGHPKIASFRDYGAKYVLIDGSSPGSGQVFDWRLAEGVSDPSRLIVAGGLRPGNVADAIASLTPFGVDVSTGVESEPGKKDPRLIRDFIAAVRGATAGAVGEPRSGTLRSLATMDQGPFDWQEDT